jgi:nucleotide-binding universal stress UspA family protein
MISIQAILAPCDFSKESILAVKFAVSLAMEYRTKLYLLHVWEPLPSYLEAEVLNFESIQKKVLDGIKEDLTKVIPQKIKKLIEIVEILEIGKPIAHVIVEKAKELEIDIIVIATHGRTGLSHVLLGSVAEHVIRHAPCPVFVIRNPKDKFVYGWE